MYSVMPYGFESDIFFGGAIQNKTAPCWVLFLFSLGEYFAYCKESPARSDLFYA